MIQILSFKAIQRICFGLLILLNILGGLFFYFMLEEVGDSISSPIEKERPFLNKIITLQQLASDLDLQLHKQISGEIIDNSGSIEIIDKILPEVTLLQKEKVIRESDLQYLNSFEKELKRLKTALIYYKKNLLLDPASSSTEEIFEIIDESIIGINHNLNSIIAIIRRQIAESDVKVLEGIQFIQNNLIYFLLILIVGTLTILFVFNIMLTANLKKLINGTIQLGKGNLTWKRC